MHQENPLVIDPICGMTVDDATSIYVERDGKAFYFCSTHCLEQFESGEPKGKGESCCG